MHRPEVGDVYVYPSLNGRTWLAIGEESYTRNDGAVSKLTIWTANCAACGAPFTERCGAWTKVPKRLGTIHCPSHRGMLSAEDGKVRRKAGRKAARKAKP